MYVIVPISSKDIALSNLHSIFNETSSFWQFLYKPINPCILGQHSPTDLRVRLSPNVFSQAIKISRNVSVFFTAYLKNQQRPAVIPPLLRG